MISDVMDEGEINKSYRWGRGRKVFLFRMEG